jgi:hypothetical protein
LFRDVVVRVVPQLTFLQLEVQFQVYHSVVQVVVHLQVWVVTVVMEDQVAVEVVVEQEQQEGQEDVVVMV